MTPYLTFLFFFILLPLLIPSVILGLNGKRSKAYHFFLAVVMLALIFGPHLKETASLIFYVGWQFVLLKAYLVIRRRSNSTTLFYLGIFLSILPLIIVKGSAIIPGLSVFGFLGISYMTFRSVQVLIEIRDGLLKEIDVKIYFRFLLFFPTIASGPIDRYRRFRKDVLAVPTKEAYKDMLYSGINKLFLGFLYKFIIGYYLHVWVITTPFVKHHTLLTNIIYMYGYSMYLFFDFAGYSAFAIGVAYILGYRVPENFNRPFISRNIKEFWNRWHMTLSFWFRDFIFMRFVFLVTKKKWIANRHASANLGYLVLFLTMGLWHGFMVHYILYGLYHAMLFIGYDWLDRKNKTRRFWPKNKWTNVLGTIITFQLVCFGFLIFSGRIIPF